MLLLVLVLVLYRVGSVRKGVRKEIERVLKP